MNFGPDPTYILQSHRLWIRSYTVVWMELLRLTTLKLVGLTTEMNMGYFCKISIGHFASVDGLIRIDVAAGCAECLGRFFVEHGMDPPLDSPGS